MELYERFGFTVDRKDESDVHMSMEFSCLLHRVE